MARREKPTPPPAPAYGHPSALGAARRDVGALYASFLLQIVPPYALMLERWSVPRSRVQPCTGTRMAVSWLAKKLKGVW